MMMPAGDRLVTRYGAIDSSSFSAVALPCTSLAQARTKADAFVFPVLMTARYR